MSGHRTTARGILFLLAICLAGIATAASASAPGPVEPVTQGAKPFIFPIVGAASYTDDYGDPRGTGSHDGNDIMAPRRAIAVAAEAGRVKFWTTSRNAGCMLYLYGDSGTMYLYIHLNNDLGSTNDNRGGCKQGVSYAPGLGAGDRVRAGEPVGFVGDSGDADGIHPHLHFEVHPKGGASVNPYPFLRQATRLLFAARPGSTFTLAVTGSVVELGNGSVEVRATRVRSWPGSRLTRHDDMIVRLTASATADPDSTAVLLAAPAAQTRGRIVTVYTAPAKVTLAAQAGEAGSLSAARVVFR
jgi:hypothetical protein